MQLVAGNPWDAYSLIVSAYSPSLVNLLRTHFLSTMFSMNFRRPRLQLIQAPRHLENPSQLA